MIGPDFFYVLLLELEGRIDSKEIEHSIRCDRNYRHMFGSAID